MSEGKKLYEVTVTVTYYAYTETPDSAADYANDATLDACLQDEIHVKEIKSRPYRIAPGWDDGNLVYCHGFDTTLGEALATLPEKEPLR